MLRSMCTELAEQVVQGKDKNLMSVMVLLGEKFYAGDHPGSRVLSFMVSWSSSFEL